MAKSVHVNGECLARVAPQATPSALADLGYTINGADLEFRRHVFEIKADTGGGDDGAAVDMQALSLDCLIRLELVIYDEAVLASIRKFADETAEGGLPSAGRLMGVNNHLFRLLLTSPQESLPWNFPTCYLADSYSVKLGSKRTVWNTLIRAVALIGTGGSKDTILYNRSIT